MINIKYSFGVAYLAKKKKSINTTLLLISTGQQNMQGEGKTMIKRGSVISQKRPVRVYEDNENPDAVKRLKASSSSKPISGFGGLRKPLADLNNVGVVRAREDALKDVVAKIKGVYQGRDSQKCKITKGPTSDVVKEAVTSVTTNRAEEGLETECSDRKNEEEKQLPEGSVISLYAENHQKEKIQQQNQRVFSVAYYGTEIYKYLFAVEKRYGIPKNHLEGQVLDGLMRAVLVDWLASVVDSLDLMQETFQLTVYTLDKFMSIDKTTNKASAQLVGLAALFVAAKYEETESIELGDLTYFCAKKWNAEDIKSMECTLLKAVNYQLGRPLAIHFIRRLSRIGGASPMEHSYAKFFADTSLLSYQLCHVKPSLIAAASMFLAFCISRDRIDTSFWTSTLTLASTYRLEDFRDLLPQISRAVTGATTGELQGVQTRYSRSQLFCVSLMPGCRPQTGIINHF